MRRSFAVRRGEFSLRCAGMAALLVLLGACGSPDNENAESAQADEAQPSMPAAADDESQTSELQPDRREQVLAAPSVGDLLPEPMDVVWRTWIGDFEAIVDRRVLRVVVPYGGYQFYYEGGMPKGAIYELLRVFGG